MYVTFLFLISITIAVYSVFFVFCFGLILYVLVNSYGHVGTVSSPNHTYFLGKLD